MFLFYFSKIKFKYQCSFLTAYHIFVADVCCCNISVTYRPIHSIISFLEHLDVVKNFDGKVAVVMTPCMLRGLDAIMKNDASLKEKIVMKLGYDFTDIFNIISGTFQNSIEIFVQFCPMLFMLLLQTKIWYAGTIKKWMQKKFVPILENAVIW